MKSSIRLLSRPLRPNKPFRSAIPLQAVISRRKFATTAFEDDDMGKDKEKSSFQLKVPKGTKDWEGKDMVIRDKIFNTITQVFKRHGAVTIDTYVRASTQCVIVTC